MTIFQRPLLLEPRGRQANVFSRFIVGLLTLALSAAFAHASTRETRLHARAHSAGRAPSLVSVAAKKKSQRRKSGGMASKAPHHSAPSKARARNSRRGHREPEVVDDPIPMHRAAARVPANRVFPRTAEKSRPTVQPRGEHAKPIVLAEATAASSRPRPQTSGEIYASGEAHPDEAGDNSQPADANALDSVRQALGQPPSVVMGRPGATAMVSAVNNRTIPAMASQPRTPSASEEAELDSGTSAAPADHSTAGASAVRELGEEAAQPMTLPMYARSGRLMMPAPLRGSHEILVHQNEMADHDGLQRIRNDAQLNRLRAQHLLVSFPENSSLRVNEGLPENRRYARPWTVKFAADAGKAFYAEFGVPLQVNSAVRTVSYQLRLQRVNGNAAAVAGDGASPHLTGQAIDLAKRGMSEEQIAWMRTYLLPLIEAGKVDVEEEFQQACFHISVYKAYVPAPKKRPEIHTQIAQLRGEPRGPRGVQHSASDDER